METEDPLIDNVSRVRDYLRRHPDASAEEVKIALALANKTVATELIKEAKKMEHRIQTNLVKEDIAAVNAPPVEVEQRVFLKTASGISHPLTLVSDGKRNVVFELEDRHLAVVRQ